MDKKTFFISKYSPPWIGVPLIENIERSFPNKIIFLTFSLNLLSFIKIQMILLRKMKSLDKIIIYNDASILILIYPLLKIISLFKEINCYYIFESKWFNKIGDMISPLISSILNSGLYKKIFVLDGFLKNYLISKGVDRNKEFIFLSTGINFKKFAPSKKEFSKVLLYVGSMHKRRKLSKIIKAFYLCSKKINGLKLIMVGEGSDKINLESLSKQLGISDKIFFTGNIPPSEVPKRIKGSDICITFYPPKIFDIQLPFKTLEYMACKKPVVSIETKANRYYFKDKHEILLTKFSEFDLVEKIIYLLKNEKDRGKIAINGFKIVKKKFKWGKVMAKLKNEI